MLSGVAEAMGNDSFGRAIARTPAATASGDQSPFKATVPALDRAVLARKEADIDAALIKRELLTKLREQVNLRMSLSFTKFLKACETVQKDEEEARAKPTLLQQLVEIAVGALAPGLVNMALGPLREELRSTVAALIDTHIKKDDLKINAFVKADDFIKEHVKDIDAGKAQGALKAAQAKFATAPTDAPPAANGSDPSSMEAPNAPGGVGGGTSFQPAPADASVATLMGQFLQNFSVQIQGIGESIAGVSDPAALVALKGVFDQNKVTAASYASQIRNLVRMHGELAKAAENPNKKAFGGTDYQKIIMLEAWGHKGPAIIDYQPGSIAAGKRGHWKFVKWVPKEMEHTAIVMGQGQTTGAVVVQNTGLETAKAGEPYPAGYMLPILGHIDKPHEEGDRIVTVDMYGKVRPAKIRVSGDKATFISWFGKGDAKYDDASAAVVTAAQTGGANFDPGKFTNHVPAPQD